MNGPSSQGDTAPTGHARPSALLVHDGIVPPRGFPGRSVAADRPDGWLEQLDGGVPAVMAIFAADLRRAARLLERVRSRPTLARTRLFVFVPGGDPAGLLPEEEYDVEAVFESGLADAETLEQVVVNGQRAFHALGDDPLLPYYYLDARHNDVFTWFERSRWDWSEAPDLEEVRPELLSDEQIWLTKHAAIAEFGTLPGAHNFLREWADEFSFSTWALAWGAEESRHSLLLCRYLRVLGVEVLAKHAQYKRRPYPEGPTRVATLMMNIISESRASEYYGCAAEITREPVLKRILELLSRDEARHAAAFYQFAKELCDHDPGRNLAPALEMAYVWLADRSAGMRHPSGFFYTHSPSTEGFRRGERYLQGFRSDVTDRADARVLAMLRKLTGDASIRSVREIRRWLRTHL